MEEWLKKFLESLGKSSIAANEPGLISSGNSTVINPSDLKTGFGVLSSAFRAPESTPVSPSEKPWEEQWPIYGTTTPESRLTLLAGLNATPASDGPQYGPDKVWILNGRRYTEGMLLQGVYGDPDESKTKQAQSALSNIRSLQPAPSTGAGGPPPVYYQSLADKNYAEIQDLQAKREFEARKYSDALIQQNFTNNMALHAQAVGDTKLSNDARDMQFKAGMSVADSQLKIVDLQRQQSNLQTQYQYNVDMANATAANEAARFNAQQAFAVEQANVAAQQRRQEQLQSLARDISEAAKAPGDYGKLAALTLANAGWGAPATAIGKGAELRTTESLAPLESQLRTRKDVMAQPERPFTVTPITPERVTAPVIAPLDLSKISVPVAPTFETKVPVIPTATGTTSVASTPQKTSYGDYLASSGVPSWAIAITPGATTGGGESSGTTAMAKGGIAKGAYISGERGPELNIPLGDKTIVLNQKQMKAAGIDLKKLMSNSNKPKQFADGGVFDQGWGNVTDPDRTLSMNFLNDALARARAGTPWQSGPLPTPVYASTPGFSPLVMQTLGSLTSMAQGIPTEYFQELAAKYRPSGVRESVTQRTA